MIAATNILDSLILDLNRKQSMLTLKHEPSIYGHPSGQGSEMKSFASAPTDTFRTSLSLTSALVLASVIAGVLLLWKCFYRRPCLPSERSNLHSGHVEVPTVDEAHSYL